METKNIFTLLSIIENGSFQAAANKLHYSQSTVTFQVQQLEKELGIKLFERIGKKMVLTQKAQEILPDLNRLLDTYNSIIMKSLDDNMLKGSVSITMPETVLVYLMQPILQEFTQIAPNVTISIETVNCSNVRDKIFKGHSDIGLHYELIGTNDSLISSEISKYSLSLVAGINTKLNSEYFENQNSSLNYTYVKNERQSYYQVIFEKYLKDQDIAINNVINLSSVEAIKKTVMSNVGFTYLPTFSVQKEIEDQSLIELETGLLENDVKLYYTYHKNKVLTPAMSLFLDLIKKHLS